MANIKIGPRFGDELQAAGLTGLPFTWAADGTISYGEAITPKQRKAIETVLAAHDPAKPSRADTLAKLVALDAFIPRGLEDMWTAMQFDTAKLPKTQQQRLVEKAKLRQTL